MSDKLVEIPLFWFFGLGKDCAQVSTVSSSIISFPDSAKKEDKLSYILLFIFL
jgi:hypothetical protein